MRKRNVSIMQFRAVEAFTIRVTQMHQVLDKEIQRFVPFISTCESEAGQNLLASLFTTGRLSQKLCDSLNAGQEQRLMSTPFKSEGADVGPHVQHIHRARRREA
jgi:hypothetical protein